MADSAEYKVAIKIGDIIEYLEDAIRYDNLNRDESWALYETISSLKHTKKVLEARHE